MAEELFGSPIGRERAEKDMAGLAMNDAHMMHLATQDMMAPYLMGQRQAQGRYLNARAGALENKSAADARISALAQGEDWTDEEKLNPAWKFARLAMSANAPDQAVTYATKAAGIDRAIASSETNAARAQLIQVRTRLGQIDELSRSTRTVDSPEALQAVLQKHAQTTGEDTGMLDEQGNLLPQAAEHWETIKDNIIKESLSEKDRLAADYRERSLASAERERASKQDSRKFWQDAGNQEDRAAAQARGRGTKSGAAVLDKESGVKLGTDFVSSQFNNLDKDQARIYGRKVTERAQQLRDKNSALTPTEAISEAFKKMDESGDFEGLSRKAPGAKDSEFRPLKLPDDKDMNKLKVGFWYHDGNTKMQWGGPGVGWKKQQTVGGKGVVGKAAYVPPTIADAEDTGNEDDAMALESEED